MTDEMINDLAMAFFRQKEFVDNFEVGDESSSIKVASWNAQRQDDIIAVANVIHKHRPDYHMGTYYELAGYEGTYPRH